MNALGFRSIDVDVREYKSAAKVNDYIETVHFHYITCDTETNWFGTST